MSPSVLPWQLPGARPTGRPARVALVPCAGTGSRSGADRPKQYVEVAGKTLVHWTLEALLGCVDLDAVAVVLSPQDQDFERAVPAQFRQRVHTGACGGATRADSVSAGLGLLAAAGLGPDDWVLVHDAARCLLTPGDVSRLIAACHADPVGGLLAMPVPDTLKRANLQGRVEATVPRDALWAAQTPQMFRLGNLQHSLTLALRAGATVTDEASAVEWAGSSPQLVMGGAHNIKVTYPADFALAERVLASRQP